MREELCGGAARPLRSEPRRAVRHLVPKPPQRLGQAHQAHLPLDEMVVRALKRCTSKPRVAWGLGLTSNAHAKLGAQFWEVFGRSMQSPADGFRFSRSHTLHTHRLVTLVPS